MSRGKNSSGTPGPPDRAAPGSCSECGGEGGSHNQVPYSEAIYDKKAHADTGEYRTVYRKCSRS